MKTEKYKKLLQVSNEMKDDNSCTVLAGCVAFNLKYEQGYRLLEKYGNRVRGDGVTTANCWNSYKVINEFLGLKNRFSIEWLRTNRIKSMAGGKTMTVGNCTNYLNPRKSYIVFVRGHAIGVSNNIVHDWSQGTKRPVIDIFEVTDTESRAKVKPVEKVFKMGGFGAILDTL